MKQKFFVIVLGLFCFFVFLEAGLSISYTIYSWLRRDVSPRQNQVSDYTIACLGNSYTYGSGASKEMSYPAQLQRLFDAASKDLTVQIINKGVVALNTAELLAGLDSFVYDSPDMVIIQVGEANMFNRYRYSDYVRRKRQKKNPMVLVILEALYKSRSYRFFVYMVYNLSNKSFFVDLPDKKGSADDVERIDQWLNSIPLSDFAGVKYDQEEIRRYIISMRREIVTDPSDPRNYYILGRLYLLAHEYSMAAEIFIEGVTIAPGYRDRERENKNYLALRRLCMYAPDMAVRKRIESFVSVYAKKNPRAAENFMLLSPESVFRWVEDDIQELVFALRKKKIGVVLMNYPLLPAAQEKKRREFFSELNIMIRELAVRLHVPMIDVERGFKGLVDVGETLEQYFVNDGHCNAAGYAVMARAAFEVIQQTTLR